MAVKIKNSKGFIVYKMKGAETMKLGGCGVCDYCNNTSANGYLVAVLKSYYCEKCYRDWLKRAKYYEEDRRYELKYINYYDKIFKIKGELEWKLK